MKSSYPRLRTPSTSRQKTLRAVALGLLLAASAALVLTIVSGAPVRASEASCLKLAGLKWPEYVEGAQASTIHGYYAERLQGLLLAEDAGLPANGPVPVADGVTVVKGPHPSDDMSLALLSFADPSQCYFLILNDEPLVELLVELYEGTKEV